MEVLLQAQQVGLMGSEHKFIIASLVSTSTRGVHLPIVGRYGFRFQDMHTLNLDPFKYSGTNITGMRLVRPHDSEFRSTVSQWTNNMSPLEPDDLFVSPEQIQVRSSNVYSMRSLLLSNNTSSLSFCLSVFLGRMQFSEHTLTQAH